MDTITFAVLPFIHVRKDTQLGPYTLWPNTPENWRRHLGTDESAFLDRYRLSSGENCGSEASVLTRPDPLPPGRQHWSDAVVALSTCDWLSDPRAGDSSPWLFEASTIKRGDHDIVRFGKFSWNLTDTEHDALYPDPYTNPRTFDAYLATDQLKYFEQHLGRQNDSSARLMTALEHLYRARRSAPYFGSPFDDIETLWSALEACYETPIDGVYRYTSAANRFIRDWAPKKAFSQLLEKHPQIFERLGVSSKPWDRLRKSDLVARQLIDELRPVNSDTRVDTELFNIVDQLYTARNLFTHGGQPDQSALLVENQGADLRDLVFTIWWVLLSQRISGTNPFTSADLQRRLRNRILEKTIHDELVNSLRSSRRDDWCDDNGEAGDPEALERAAMAIQDALTIEPVSRRYHTRSSYPLAKSIPNAKQTAVLALSAWLKHTEKASPAQIAATPPLVGFYDELSGILSSGKSKKMAKNLIERDLVKAIVRRRAHEETSYTRSARATLILGKRIPIWQWIAAVKRLEELSVGHEISN